MQTLLISGSDTDVGKTVATAALLAYGQAHLTDRQIAVCKPLQSGTGDREFYQTVFHLGQPPETVNPLHYQHPLAPPLAAEREGRSIDLAQAWQVVRALQHSHDWVFVEGLGGLGAPVTHELVVADLARDWRLPTLLVIPVQLGCIGQAVANVALARWQRVPLIGILLNCVNPCTPAEIEQWAPEALIQSLTRTTILGTLPYLEDSQNVSQLVAAGACVDWEILQFALSHGVSPPAVGVS